MENLVAVVQLLSCVRLFVTQWTAARRASLSLTISWSLLKLKSIESERVCHTEIAIRSNICIAYSLVNTLYNSLSLVFRSSQHAIN